MIGSFNAGLKDLRHNVLAIGSSSVEGQLARSFENMNNRLLNFSARRNEQKDARSSSALV